MVKQAMKLVGFTRDEEGLGQRFGGLSIKYGDKSVVEMMVWHYTHNTNCGSGEHVAIGGELGKALRELYEQGVRHGRLEKAEEIRHALRSD